MNVVTTRNRVRKIDKEKVPLFFCPHGLVYRKEAQNLDLYSLKLSINFDYDIYTALSFTREGTTNLVASINKSGAACVINHCLLTHTHNEAAIVFGLEKLDELIEEENVRSICACPETALALYVRDQHPHINLYAPVLYLSKKEVTSYGESIQMLNLIGLIAI